VFAELIEQLERKKNERKTNHVIFIGKDKTATRLTTRIESMELSLNNKSLDIECVNNFPEANSV
jgi:hypothetical protein